MSEQFDLIIVGAGGTGLTAASEAARLGAKTLLIEKGETPGGSTAWSIGSFTSSDTPHQHKSGVHDDNPDRHFADMPQVNGKSTYPDNLELTRILTKGAPEAFKWLMKLGVEFIGPNPEVNHSRPRMHNVVPGPGAYIYYVGRECRRYGAEVWLATELQDLVFSGDTVSGVRVRRPDGQVEEITASRGVVLASGDFSASKEMRARFFKPEVVRAEPVNNLNTGEGIALGERYGGEIVNGGFGGAYIPKMRFMPPPRKHWLQRLPPTRLVSKSMQWGWTTLPQSLIRPFLMRFITTALGPESNLFENGAALIDSQGALVNVDLKSLAKELALGPVNKGYIVFDNRIAQLFRKWPNFISTAPNVAYAYLDDYRAARKDVFHEADSLEALARLLDVPPERLDAAVADHNQGESDLSRKLVKPPFYALGPVRGYITTTNGGLNVNAALQVLRADGSAIDGLYAAGAAGQGGMILGGHGHHIGWAFVSGLRVARSALGEIKPS